jgi:hypothetical protein
MKELIKDNGFKRLVALFIITTVAVFMLNSFLTEQNVDTVVVAAGNAIIFLTSVFTLMMYGRAKRSKSAHGFSRNVYAAFVTKFFVLITTAMVYFYFSEEINKKAVFICLGLYIVYLFIGASYASRVEKKKPVHAPHKH